MTNQLRAHTPRFSKGGTLFRNIISISLLCLGLCAASCVANAQLARVGPVDSSNGFPQWYQDYTGIALDLCLPDPNELNAGLCLLLPGDIPGFPIVFPTSFPEEAFFYNATAQITLPNGGRATLVISQEAAFAVGEPAPGDQITFARIRFVIDTPSAGTYRVVYPYGEKTFTEVPSGKRGIFFTEDFGVAPGIFSGALKGRIGPWLRPSATRGGAPLDLIVIAGKTYLGDAATLTQVTGSPFGADHNVFRLEGPSVGGPGIDFIETDLFTVMGRVHTAPIPSPMTLDRTTYLRDASAAQIDVYATAVAGIGKNPPVLAVTSTANQPKQLDQDSSKFHTQVVVGDPQQLPADVTVTNSGDVPESVLTSNVVDEVTVARAEYDASNKTLTVEATSGEKLNPPVLSIADLGELTDGKLMATNVLVPPPLVTVRSSAGGLETKAVAVISSGITGSQGGGQPQAADDNASTGADTPVIINVLANDSAPTMTVRLLGAPQHGTATLNADNTFTYTPAFAYAGSDFFTYVATGATGVDSNIGTVTVDVSFTNHPPIANADVANTPIDRPITVDVTANDRDPDASTAIVPGSVHIVSVSAGSAVANGDGTITYTPAVQGNALVTYTITDDRGMVSAPGTLSVTVLAPDLARITTGRYRSDRGDWDIRGTTSVPGPGNVVTIHIGPTLDGPVLGVIDSDVTGAWRVTLKGSAIAPDGTQTISIESQQGGSQLGFVLRID
jgi:hypothetical protein